MTCGCPYHLNRRSLLSAALDLVGPERVLFGSDEPFIPTPQQITQLLDRRLPAPVLAGIERENALRLIPSLADRRRA